MKQALCQRRAFASVFVLVAMVAAVLIATASLMHVASQSRFSANGPSGPQMDLLFEAALDLAKSRLASQASYEGESWELDPTDNGLRQAAKIVIEVKPNEDAKLRDVKIDIDYGDDSVAVRRDQKTWTISLPQSEQNE